MKAVLRWLGLVVLAFVALQLFFVVRIAAMVVIDPESTSFERSEAWTLLTTKGNVPWRQQWMHYASISDQLKRAVIASEDDGFVSHDGVDWNAIEKAWERNAKAEALANKAQARAPDRPVRAPKIRGGSTITLLLEQLLSKQRILEIYLNSVEWGEGVFGAEAAAQHYFRKSASRLSATEAARLAVMLPAPKRFEKTPGSAYLTGRTRTIL